MKKHLVSPKMMAATLTTTLLLTGTLLTAEARDRGGRREHRNNDRIEQRDSRHRSKHSPSKVVYRKRTTHVTKVVTHVPSRSRYIKRLPADCRTVHVDGHRYYSHSGRYYRHTRYGYKVVHTPRIRRLPRHARRVMVNHTPYYVVSGVYYCHHNGYYEVCEAPMVQSRVTLSAGPVSITVSDYDECHH